MSDSMLSRLPSVSTVLSDERIAPLVAGKNWMTRLVRRVVDDRRDRLRQGGAGDISRSRLLDDVVADVVRHRDRLLEASSKRVINCTGVVVHTNLGRSIVPPLARQWANDAAEFPQDLEFDLESGTRGHRGRRVEEKAALLAGAEDALIVNNNAAAVWLAVRCVSCKGKVLLSRGEIVAIGGSFRINEILQETGCWLIEVGTTNRTALADYERELEAGATVLKVHRSNFHIDGFTEEVELADLAALCGERGARLIYDAGRGALFPFDTLGLPGERMLDEDLATGADLVTCSGDKLLGGCQAGIVLGRKDLIQQLRVHPMRRAFRVDKTTLAALDAVLTLYMGAEGVPRIPTLQQLSRTPGQLDERANELGRDLAADLPDGWSWVVIDGRSSVGGGSFSDAVVSTRLLLWRGPKAELEQCHARLRLQDPAVVTRMNQDGLAVDLRAVDPSDTKLLAEAFRLAWK